jgi:1-aminocyclopropane-1-carboxylate deaminase/D-cysteine desulfhydrase-like pyridoxal-dependent ACC family enzyme
VNVPRVAIGQWPTPIEPRTLWGRTLWVKREGASHPRYGGNKIRTLEVWLAHARDRGAKRIWAIGAYGSNHAIATVLHAPAAGLEAGAIVFPQPSSEWAIENAGALVATGCPIVRLRSVAEVPFAAFAVGRKPGAIVMPPGGATPIGTFGAAHAALELAQQVAAGVMPPPRRIVLAIGSTCTTAGLMVGLAVARAQGAWPWPLPIVHGVRVTPWPITSRTTILALALRSLSRAVALGAPKHARLGELVVDGSQLGRGYGHLTTRGERALAAIHAAGGPRMDGVYSAKAAASLLALHRAGDGPLLLWASKSEAVLSPPSSLASAPRALARWLSDS